MQIDTVVGSQAPTKAQVLEGSFDQVGAAVGRAVSVADDETRCVALELLGALATHPRVFVCLLCPVFKRGLVPWTSLSRRRRRRSLRACRAFGCLNVSLHSRSRPRHDRSDSCFVLCNSAVSSLIWALGSSNDSHSPWLSKTPSIVLVQTPVSPTLTSMELRWKVRGISRPRPRRGSRSPPGVPQYRLRILRVAFESG